MHALKLRLAGPAALTALLLAGTPALALAPAGTLEYEPSYFEGELPRLARRRYGSQYQPGAHD